MWNNNSVPKTTSSDTSASAAADLAAIAASVGVSMPSNLPMSSAAAAAVNLADLTAATTTGDEGNLPSPAYHFDVRHLHHSATNPALAAEYYKVTSGGEDVASTFNSIISSPSVEQLVYGNSASVYDLAHPAAAAAAVAGDVPYLSALPTTVANHVIPPSLTTLASELMGKQRKI